MAGNVFGNVFRVTTFGESHGAALGAVIDGCPAGLAIDKSEIQDALNRRRPGGGGGSANAAVTSRAETDEIEILSGIINGQTEGTPIALLIRNTSQRSSDYEGLKHTFRPGHADLTYFLKYGVRDERGGGRSSGRETAARVAAGAVAGALLKQYGVSITAYTIEAAGVKCTQYDINQIEQNLMRAPDSEAAKEMMTRIAELRKAGDSAGGIVECVIKGAPSGLGEAVFDKLDAVLSHAMLSIGAVKGIEFGSGFGAARMTGSSDNDAMATHCGEVRFLTNNAGGILGGISRGDDIVFRIAIKAVPSIRARQQTVKWSRAVPECAANGGVYRGGAFEDCEIEVEGRHDVCLCPRIVPVAEAMAAIVMADMVLQNRSARV